MNNKADIIIGANLSRMRKIAGLSQKSFGEACNPPISSQQVSKYERGDDSATGVRLCDFARVLRWSISELFKGLDGSVEGGDSIARAGYHLMNDYQSLPEHLQISVRSLIHSMAKELRG